MKNDIPKSAKLFGNVILLLVIADRVGLIGGCLYSASHSEIHAAAIASVGISQWPRGESPQLPILGPSGKQLRLNC